MSFHEITLDSLSFNPFTKPDREWMLLTAGTEAGCNTMTASWGMFGQLWNKNVFQVFVRPQRFTKTFIDTSDLISVSFLPEKYRDALKVCGSVSGKDGNKWERAGLHPAELAGTAAPAEASLVLIGRKLYVHTLSPKEFIDPAPDSRNYAAGDYHDCYIYEVLHVFENDEK